MYEAGEGVAPAGVDRLLQRIQHAVRAHGGRHPPAHHASRKHVDDERDVNKAAPGCDVREIGDPELIRTGGHELAVNEVHRATALTCVGRGDPGPAPDGPGKAHRAQQARHGAARHADAVPPQLLPDFPGAVDLLVRVIDPLNLAAELIVALRPCGPARRMCPLVPMAMIRRRGDRQHGADRLDPEHGVMVVDELDHRGDVLRRSSSAWAKYANAFRRISFARFSSRTSRSSSFNGIVNLSRAARSCPVTSTAPIVISRRTSPHPIQQTRGCGADGGEPTAGGVDRRGRDSARYREPTRTAGAERPT